MAARLPIPITIEKKKAPMDIELQDIAEDVDFEEGEPESELADNPPDNNNSNSLPQANKSVEEEEEEELTLEEHALIVIAILKPVAITMLIVIAIVYGLHVASAPSSYISFMIYQEHPTDSNTQKFTEAMVNAIVFVIMIVIVTCILVLLYKYRCLKIIYGWMIAACAILMATFGATLYYRIFQVHNLPLDWITFCIVIWNFTVVGMCSIFWRAPVKSTQGYLIIISALLACFFTRLPEWTTWAILIAVAIYDLFAVLCPRGPLRVLVELSRERDEPIPALLYNGSVVWIGMVDRNKSGNHSSEDDDHDDDEVAIDLESQPAFGDSESDKIQNEILRDDQSNPSNSQHQPNSNSNSDEIDAPLLEESQPRNRLSEEERNDRLEFHFEDDIGRSVRLGLGDFVFYSVLMGRAAMYDIITVFTCFIAIITGLFLTLVLLAIFRKALPALPISIFLGAIFYLITNVFLVPYVLLLGTYGVFV